MKTKFPCLTVVVLLSLWSATAQTAQPLPQINVSGSAEVRVAPDEVYLRVGVETRDENLDEATRQNDQLVAQALAFFNGMKVPEKDLKTDFIGVEPLYDNNVSRTKPVVYIVRKSMEVRLTMIANLESILTGMLTNGVNCIHDIDFRTTELRKHRDHARAMAIRAAKEKAEALTSELGFKCGKPLTISANDWSSWGHRNWNGWGAFGASGFNNISQNAYSRQTGPADTGSSTLSIGQISISASVNVSFAIE